MNINNTGILCNNIIEEILENTNDVKYQITGLFLDIKISGNTKY